MSDLIGTVFVIAAVALTIWFYFVVPAQMATNRNRRPGVWVLISLFFSPILAILLLIAMGNQPPEGPSS